MMPGEAHGYWLSGHTFEDGRIDWLAGQAMFL
jgi:hypothetical protein